MSLQQTLDALMVTAIVVGVTPPNYPGHSVRSRAAVPSELGHPRQQTRTGSHVCEVSHCLPDVCAGCCRSSAAGVAERGTKCPSCTGAGSSSKDGPRGALLETPTPTLLFAPAPGRLIEAHNFLLTCRGHPDES